MCVYVCVNMYIYIYTHTRECIHNIQFRMTDLWCSRLGRFRALNPPSRLVLAVRLGRFRVLNLPSRLVLAVRLDRFRVLNPPSRLAITRANYCSSLYASSP